MSILKSFLVVSVTLMTASIAHAQVGGMFGVGIYPGAQTCPYELQLGDDATNKLDEMRDKKEAISKLKDELDDAKDKLKTYEGQERLEKKKFNDFAYSGTFFNFIERHINDRKKCSDYERGPTSSSSSSTDSNKQSANVSTPMSTKVDVVSNSDWEIMCPGNGSMIASDRLCSYNNSSVAKRSDRWKDESTCSGSLSNWQTVHAQVVEQSAKVEEIKKQIETANLEYGSLRTEFKTESRKYQREKAKEMAEGGCIECAITGGGIYAPKKASGWEVAGNFALAAGGMILGSRMNEHFSDNAAKLGYSYNAPPSFGYGFPFLMNGVYGAIGAATGRGGFGCIGGMNGAGNAMGALGMMGPFGYGGMNPNLGGAFGYPNGMFGNPYGGGMYLPGMSPWGMAGPWGLNNGMYPGAMGVAMAPTLMMPYQMMPGMNAGMGLGMGMGMMPYGMMPNMAGMGMGMMPYGMMPNMAGMGMGMMPYGMMPNMAGMGMGMMPYGMMPNMAGMGMGMMPYGMMPNMAGMGMGMMPGGMGMAPYSMGMMPGMNMGMGMGMMPYGMMPGMNMGMMPGGGMMDAGMMQMQMQMQQQAMQMQMQQYQMMMQMQQQKYANYMAQQQVVAGLSQELQTIYMRLQQAQMGMYSGGYSGYGLGGGGGFGGGFGGSFGFGGGFGGSMYNGGGFNNLPYGTGSTVPPIR